VSKGKFPAVKRPTYLVDTCVFIHAFCEGGNGTQETIEASRLLLDRAESGDVQIYVSTVTIAEALSINLLRSDDPRSPSSLRRRGQERDQLKSWLVRYTVPVEVDLPLALDAGDEGRTHLLKGADAVIFASAVVAGVDALITTDKGLLKASSSRLLVRPPTEVGGQGVLSIGLS